MGNKDQRAAKENVGTQNEYIILMGDRNLFRIVKECNRLVNLESVISQRKFDSELNVCKCGCE
jgi:hypothetical protein